MRKGRGGADEEGEGRDRDVNGRGHRFDCYTTDQWHYQLVFLIGLLILQSDTPPSPSECRPVIDTCNICTVAIVVLGAPISYNNNQKVAKA